MIEISDLSFFCNETVKTQRKGVKNLIKQVMHMGKVKDSEENPKGAGGVIIPTALATIERRVGIACKIAK